MLLFHQLATDFYDIIESKAGVKKTEIILCGTMNKIASHCFEHLAVCLSNRDLEEMKEIHLEEIKDFFIKILDRKVNRDFLKYCIQGKQPYYELSTEISDTLVYAYDDYYNEIYDEYGATELPMKPERAFQLKSETMKPLIEKVEKVTEISKVAKRSNTSRKKTIDKIFIFLLLILIQVNIQ